MAEIVNLRRARKGKKRQAEAEVAKAARTEHGIARPVKELAQARSAKEKRDLAAHKLKSGNDK